MQRDSTYALGLDYGTSNVRALIVDANTGEQVATGDCDYPNGEQGVLTGPDPLLARQFPGDWQHGFVQATADALDRARAHRGFRPERIVGLGVGATGSTPLPVDRHNVPLALRDEFRHEAAAFAWLWKDHTAHDEAAEITARARELGLPYLDACGGSYRAEWFWAKVLRCERCHPHVAESAFAWVEACDWIPAWLCGHHEPGRLPRSVGAAGHKAMYHPRWGGLPDLAFLRSLSPGLVRIRERCHAPALTSDQRAGTLRRELGRPLGLPDDLPVAVGGLDAHFGAVGSGCVPGTLVKILGCSSSDCTVAPLAQDLPAIPGLCGIAPESMLPGHHGIEAGQSAVGDILHWFVQQLGVGTANPEQQHGALAAAAARQRPGESGLLALDWHNGNRCVLVDPRLSGLVLGLSLATTRSQIYRALLEATAFGARLILDRLLDHGIAIDRIVACGGLAERCPLLLQILADVTERDLLVARSKDACALGAAVFGAVVGGAHPDVRTAQRAMTGTRPGVFRPLPAAAAVYRELFALYRRLHDGFGVERSGVGLSTVMKDLLAIRDRCRGTAS